MPRWIVTAVPAALLAAIAGCASNEPAVDLAPARDTVVSVQYGTVEDLQQVAVAPDYAAGTLIGGAVGLLATVNRSGASRLGAAAVGAGIGALVARETAGSARQYSVRLADNSSLAIVTDNREIQIGDCVAIERGEHLNIRRVSPVMCTTSPSHPAWAEMHASAVQESLECQAVKRELLEAGTEQAADIAYKKLRAFCES